MRQSIVLTLTVVLIAVTGAGMWAGLTRRLSYVVTHGVSMQPLYHAGDLVVVAKKDTYRVGDIVAYRVGAVTVLHRIIDGDAAGFITKGDNNESIDSSHPTSAQLLGRAVLHVPSGGIWLQRVISPPVLGVFAFTMLAGTRGVVHRRRRTAGRRRAARRDTTNGMTMPAMMSAVKSSRRLLAAAGAIGAIGMTGTVLVLIAWTQPPAVSTTVQQPPARSTTFSYAATVPLTPAYSSTIVTSPDPVFRKVTDSVDVTFAYTGPPGRVTVDAELSTVTGWHATVPLAAAASFTGTAYRGVARLDLAALEARANAGAQAIGIRSTEVSVVIVPRFTDASGTTFAPTLKLKLTPLTMNVDGPLVAQDAATAPTRIMVPQVVHVAGRGVMRVSTARIVSIVQVLGAMLAAAAFVLAVRRTRPATESERIRQRYRQLLVEVQPMEPPSGRPIVHLTEFSTLARIAERHGLLVLHWSSASTSTFGVHDDAMTYWYCTDSAPSRQPAHAVQQDTPAAGASETAPTEPASLPDTVDALTDLADQTLFESALQSALDSSASERLCMMLIGLDDLDTMNESHGPDVADAVLVVISERLRRTVRPRDLVAQLGDGTFAVLFEDVGLAEMDGVTKRVMRTVNESIPVRGELMRVRASLGIVQANTSDQARTVIEHATAALAEAKAATNDHLVWFTDARDSFPNNGP